MTCTWSECWHLQIVISLITLVFLSTAAPPILSRGLSAQLKSPPIIRLLSERFLITSIIFAKNIFWSELLLGLVKRDLLVRHKRPLRKILTSRNSDIFVTHGSNIRCVFVEELIALPSPKGKQSFSVRGWNARVQVSYSNTVVFARDSLSDKDVVEDQKHGSDDQSIVSFTVLIKRSFLFTLVFWLTLLSFPTEIPDWGFWCGTNAGQIFYETNRN